MLLDSLLAQLAPYDCLGCAAEGRLLCSLCVRTLAPVPERCYRCRKPTESGRVCSSCKGHSSLYAVRAVASYEGVAKALVWQLKFEGKQAAAGEMAELMKPLLLSESNLIIMPIPTATHRTRQRGYDQACLLAQAIARRQHNVRYLPALRRLGQHHQVGASRRQRLDQLQQAYRCKPGLHFRGAHIVLVDDVLTTGATLEAAARTVRAAGADRVSGLVFSQA